MGIRIERIMVNRHGPLASDFALVPGDLNLIHGDNETGKTCLVESLIAILFRTGRRARAPWEPGRWSAEGWITVSGLEADPVRFTKSGRKLDEYWVETGGLPSDLSRLLVVRAGDTSLANEDDGVGRGVLKTYLTGVGLLDSIENRISATVRSATIGHEEIQGSRAGELKSRRELRDDLTRIDKLLEEVERTYASGHISALRQDSLALQAQVDLLFMARRYRAWQIREHVTDLNDRLADLPTEEGLSELTSRVSCYEQMSSSLQVKSRQLKDLETCGDDYSWTESALKSYDQVVSASALANHRPLFMWLAVVFFVAAIAIELLRIAGAVPVLMCGVLALAFLMLYHFGTLTALARAADLPELQSLKSEFQRRFGSELTGRPALEVQHVRLTEQHGVIKQLREEAVRLSSEVVASADRLSRDFADMGLDISPNEWHDVIRDLRTHIMLLGKDIRDADLQLAALDVRESENLEVDPGATWDREHHDELAVHLQSSQQKLAAEMQALDLLRTTIASETGSESREWDKLIGAIQSKREEIANAYRQITAQILAQIQVTSVIKELREEENARIAAGLKRNELTAPLYALTGHYAGIRLGTDGGLVLVSDQDEEFRVATLSTGAREQVCIALRIGFASIAMEGRPAFLILDDAFQHSDWSRRRKLIDQMMHLVQSGWQVLYFSMDDHIRGLFESAGASLGEAFKSVRLD
jgi:hypothetical protein